MHEISHFLPLGNLTTIAFLIALIIFYLRTDKQWTLQNPLITQSDQPNLTLDQTRGNQIITSTQINYVAVPNLTG